MRSALALLALCLAAATVSAQPPESSWETKEIDHFRIRHQRVAFSPGDHDRLERIYDALHPELWGLVPRLTRERIDVYLYKDQDSYREGKFNPPAWSAGLFSIGDGQRALALFEPVDTAVAAHELTHLYLHTYFSEQNAKPPPWLDEGLAGMLQNEALSMADPRDKGPVLRSLLPLSQLISSRPGRDSPQDRVGAWYQQAHSVVRFIKRDHLERRFTEFCEKLRAGAETEKALREVYGYEDLHAFEDAWKKWRPKKPLGEPVGLEDL